MRNPTEVPVKLSSPVTDSHELPATADRPDASLTSKSAEDVSGSTPLKDADSVAEKQETSPSGSADLEKSDSRAEEPPSSARDGSPIREHYGRKEVAVEDEPTAGENKQATEGANEREQEGTREYMTGLPLVLLTFGLCMVKHSR